MSLHDIRAIISGTLIVPPVQFVNQGFIYGCVCVCINLYINVILVENATQMCKVNLSFLYRYSKILKVIAIQICQDPINLESGPCHFAKEERKATRNEFLAKGNCRHEVLLEESVKTLPGFYAVESGCLVLHISPIFNQRCDFKMVP